MSTRSKNKRSEKKGRKVLGWNWEKKKEEAHHNNNNNSGSKENSIHKESVCCAVYHSYSVVYIKHQAIRILFTTQTMSTFSTKHCIRRERERKLLIVCERIVGHRFVSLKCDDFIYCLVYISALTPHKNRSFDIHASVWMYHILCVLFIFGSFYFTPTAQHNDQHIAACCNVKYQRVQMESSRMSKRNRVDSRYCHPLLVEHMCMCMCMHCV